MGRHKKEKKAGDYILILFIIAGIAFLAVGGYMYYDGKAKEEASQAKADSIVENRDLSLFKDKSGKELTQLQSSWLAKEKLEPFNKGDIMGKLFIPKMDAELPIVSGADKANLKKGVGHVTETLLPLDGGQVVLSGHRDTTLKGIGVLEIGDKFVVQMSYGDFEYEIIETFVTNPNDLTVIVPHDEEILTVTTCYPFNFIGYAPNRYIMHAKPTFDMSELDIFDKTGGDFK